MEAKGTKSKASRVVIATKHTSSLHSLSTVAS